VTASEKECFVDITAFLNLPQTTAAKKLGMPTSTLSKRWREAVRNRKWPYRIVNKLDKEITTLLHNIGPIQQGPGSPQISEEVQEALGYLLRRRQEELRPVVIRWNPSSSSPSSSSPAASVVQTNSTPPPPTTPEQSGVPVANARIKEL
jgi:hypothetical protein